MNLCQRIAFFFVTLTFAFAPSVVFAVGEQNGRIRGTVTEAETGAPVTGATVTASGPNLIGPPQQVTTHDDGTYELIELPPGPYNIEVSYVGVKPIRRRVVVLQGETSPLNVAWSAELTTTEVTEVIEERHLTRPDTTQTGTVLSSDTEAKLATQRTYTDVAQQVAGIKSDRGLPVVKGANRLSNRYLVDGMDITDSVTNNFATQVNFDSIASLEVLTGGMEAQYNALGGVINVNTATGSDELHLDTSLYVNNQAFSAKPIYGPQLYQHEEPFATIQLGPNQGYNANFNVSGPLIKHKLWYSLSLEYDYAQSSLQPAPPLNVQHPPRTEHDFHPRLKITYAPSAKHRLTLSGSGDPAIVFNRAQSNSGLGITEYGQTQGGAFGVLQWDYFHSQNLSTNLQTGFNYNTVHQAAMCEFLGGHFVNYGPKDAAYSDKNYQCDRNEAQHFNSVDGTTWYQGSQNNDDKRYTAQFDPSVSVRGKGWGEHDAKFGLQTRAVYHTFSQHTLGGATYSDGNGAPLEAGLCDPTTGMGCTNSQVTYYPSFTDHAFGFGIGAFAQDRWKVWKRLTVIPGVRVDYGITNNTARQTVTESWGIGPRLGFALDLTGDQKTIFTGYYGRANETLNLLPSIYADPASTSTTYRWDPTANNGKGGYVFKYATGGAGGYKLDPHAKTPHTDEVTLGINREFFRNSVVSLNYTFKKVANIWSEVEINQIWDPSGQRVVGYVNGQPRSVLLYTTPDLAYRIYHGIDLVVESRPTPHWDFYAAYTLSWLYGPGSDEIHTVGGGNAFANPRQTNFYYGYLPEDVRHNVKIHASYLFHGLTVGGNVTYATGNPLTKQYWNQFTSSYGNRRTPQGTTPAVNINDPTSIAAFRTPDTVVINLRASYDFHEQIHQHLIVIADLFNALNFDTPTGLENRDIPTFAAANQSRLSPLKFQLAARYLF